MVQSAGVHSKHICPGFLGYLITYVDPRTKQKVTTCLRGIQLEKGVPDATFHLRTSSNLATVFAWFHCSQHYHEQKLSASWPAICEKKKD